MYNIVYPAARDAVQVQLICLPSGISHLLQPLSDTIISSLDNAVTERVQQRHGSQAVEAAATGTESRSGARQESIITALRKTWCIQLPVDELKLNFIENGLYPLNPRAISMDRIVATETPLQTEADMSPPESPVIKDEEDDVTH